MACFTGAAQAVTFLNHAPLLPLIMADLGVTPAGAGLLSTVMFAVGALVAPFTGRVLDRFGATHVMTASLLMLIASSLARQKMRLPSLSSSNASTNSAVC